MANAIFNLCSAQQCFTSSLPLECLLMAPVTLVLLPLCPFRHLLQCLVHVCSWDADAPEVCVWPLLFSFSSLPGKHVQMQFSPLSRLSDLNSNLSLGSLPKMPQKFEMELLVSLLNTSRPTPTSVFSDSALFQLCFYFLLISSPSKSPLVCLLKVSFPPPITLTNLGLQCILFGTICQSPN